MMDTSYSWSDTVDSYTVENYRKFPIRGAGRLGKTLGGAIIRERTFPASGGFLQNENRTIYG